MATPICRASIVSAAAAFALVSLLAQPAVAATAGAGERSRSIPVTDTQGTGAKQKDPATPVRPAPHLAVEGKYTGRNDPVPLVRPQMNSPATGEALTPFAISLFVAGGMRGSHNVIRHAVRSGPTPYSDNPPLVTYASSASTKILNEPVDNFAHAFRKAIRNATANRPVEMRRHGQPMAEREYTRASRRSCHSG